MVNYKHKKKDLKKKKIVVRKNLEPSVNKVNVLILLAYGFVTVLTPNLQANDSSGPKFLSLAILNFLVFCYLTYQHQRHNTMSIFGQIFRSKIGIAYSLLLLISILSFFKAINVIESVVFFSKIFTTFTAAWIISIVLSSDKSALKYLSIGLAGLLVFDSIRVFYGIFIYTQGELESILLLEAGYSNKNILAAALFVKLPFALWLMTFEKGWIKKFGVVSLFLGIIAVLFMSSRAFYLGLIILSISYSSYIVARYLSEKNKQYFKDGIIYLGSLIIAFLVFSAVQSSFYPEDKTIYNRSVIDRFATIASANKTESRPQRWKMSLDLIKENPVLGVGLGNWKVVILEKENPLKSQFSYSVKAHNDFIEITAESGIIAGLLYISIFVIIVFNFIRVVIRRKSVGTISLLFLPAFGILTYAFDAFFNFPQHQPEMQSLFALYVGMGISFSMKEPFNPQQKRFNVNNKWKILIPAFSILLISATSYIVYLNFKSLKIQLIYRQELLDGKNQKNSSFYIEQFPSIPNLATTSAPIFLIIAERLIHEKQYKKAIELLSSKNPSPFESRREYLLSSSYFQLKQLDSALVYIQKAYKQKPLYYEHTGLYCGILELMGKDEEAISLLNIFLNKNSKQKEAWLFKGALTYNLGDSLRAIEIMDSAYHLFPGDAIIAKDRDIYAVLFYLPKFNDAIKLYNAKKFKQAAELFEQSEEGFQEMGGHGRFPKFLEMWGLCYLHLQSFPQAKLILQRILDKDPEHYISLSNLGNIAYDIDKDYDEAISLYRRCLRSDTPEYFDLYSKLGSIYYISDEADLSIKNFENALQYGSSKGVLKNLYHLWIAKGNEEKANYYKTLMDNYGKKESRPF